MSGNYHVQFLGGKGAVKPLTYPVLQCQLARKENKRRAEKELSFFKILKEVK
jgi:hypothetical protein